MQPKSPQADSESEREYRAIEAALLQTARGRWFLAENGRRARRVDGEKLEDAILRLKTSLREPPAVLGQLRAEITELRSVIETAGVEARAKPGRIDPAHGPQSAHGILREAEDIHELAWSIQSSSPDQSAAEKIAAHAARLYALSMQNSAESERLTKLSAALDRAIAKLDAVLETLALEMHSGDDAVPLPQFGDDASGIGRDAG